MCNDFQKEKDFFWNILQNTVIYFYRKSTPKTFQKLRQFLLSHALVKYSDSECNLGQMQIILEYTE